MVDVRKDYPRFQKAGAETAVVTMGSVEQTAAFCQKHELPGLCLADPELAAYRAFQLERARVSQIAGPAVWLRSLWRLLRHGTGKPIGDVKQLHGTFAIDTSGTLRFVYYPANSADNPSHDDVLSALESTTGP